jgi:hypothetical protein
MVWPWVSRGRYDDLKEAHRREVDILVTWIEQLQQQVGAFNSPRDPGEPQKLSEHPAMAMYVTDEEEALIDAHAQEIIDDEQFQQAMNELRSLKVEIG